MTDLNTSNLQNTVNNALQAVLNQKTSILLWTNSNLPHSFILKDKDGKRYLGLPRKDRKGENYWKFKEIRGKKQSNSLEKNPVTEKEIKDYANHANASKE